METDSTKPRTHDDDNDRVKKMAEQEMKASIEIQTRSLDASKHHRTAVQFAKLWNHGDGADTDIVIKCGDRSWKAHSIVLKSRLEFLKDLLDPEEQEERDGVINLVGDNVCALGHFLENQYTRHLSGLIRRSHDDPELESSRYAPEIYAALAQIANKYVDHDLMEEPKASNRWFQCRLLDALFKTEGSTYAHGLKRALVWQFNVPLCGPEESDQMREFTLKNPSLAGAILEEMSRREERWKVGEYPYL